MHAVLRAFTRLSVNPMAAGTSGLSSVRTLRTTPRLAESLGDEKRRGTKLNEAQLSVHEGRAMMPTGAIGSHTNLLARLPTVETLKMDIKRMQAEFDGIPYDQLPVVFIKATKNNTLITLTNHKLVPLTNTSCRMEGFKNARKKTTIAGQTTGVAAGLRLLRRGIRTVRVQVKGIGPGRMASIKGLASAGVNVVSITDHTAINEIGPRPRKIRRV